MGIKSISFSFLRRTLIVAAGFDMFAPEECRIYSCEGSKRKSNSSKKNTIAIFSSVTARKRPAPFMRLSMISLRDFVEAGRWGGLPGHAQEPYPNWIIEVESPVYFKLSVGSSRRNRRASKTVGLGYTEGSMFWPAKVTNAPFGRTVPSERTTLRVTMRRKGAVCHACG